MECPYEKSSDLHLLRDRLFITSGGGGGGGGGWHGFPEKCGVSKLYPQKIITDENCTP